MNKSSGIRPGCTAMNRPFGTKGTKGTELRLLRIGIGLSLLALMLPGCERPRAYGRPNEIVVAVAPELLPILEDSVLAILAPEVPSLRGERAFHLVFEDPQGPDWELKRLAREELLIGGWGDPFIKEALGGSEDDPPSSAAEMVSREDVWARGQRVSVLLVGSSGDPLAQASPLLGELREELEQSFRQGVERRMFVSGRDEPRRDSLLTTAGFGLLLPEVYRGTRRDSLFVFRNDNPSPRELVREFVVSWWSPIPECDLDPESVLSWKERLSESAYQYPQVVHREEVLARPTTVRGLSVSEIRGTWANPPGSPWPAGGPFILWAIECPRQDRLYLIDAWLYAPDRSKREFLLQLEMVLESFSCEPDPGGTGRVTPRGTGTR